MFKSRYTRAYKCSKFEKLTTVNLGEKRTLHASVYAGDTINSNFLQNELIFDLSAHFLSKRETLRVDDKFCADRLRRISARLLKMQNKN